MKIIVDKNKINFTPEQFMRKAGYVFIIDKKMGKESFSRKLGAHHYPRLHMYLKHVEDDVIFDLHLDQKQASYKGSSMHNAEYDGQVVENEVKRLKQLMMAENRRGKVAVTKETKEKKKGFLARIFG